MLGHPAPQHGGQDARAIDGGPADGLVETHRGGLALARGARFLVAGDHGGAVDGHVRGGHDDGDAEHEGEEEQVALVDKGNQQIARRHHDQQQGQDGARLAVGVDEEADQRLEAPGQVALGEQALRGGLAQAVVEAEVPEERLVGDALEGIGQALQHVLHREDHLDGGDAEDGACLGWGGSGRSGRVGLDYWVGHVSSCLPQSTFTC